MLIPFVNFIIAIILLIDLAKSFGKGVGFGIGLLLLPIIFFPILGFGSAQYQGPTAGSLAPAPQNCVINFANQGAAVSSPPFLTATVERVVPNTLTGPNANRLGTIGSTFCALRLCYDFTQPGLRFSLKAAMPSRASSDSRACM